MEMIVANLIGDLHRERLRGREQLVAPVTLIVPGVLNGSQGPLYYPPEEIGKNPALWNHMPIVVYHPEEHGQRISARSRDVLDKQSVGILLNTTTKNDNLVAEGWFDVADTKRVDNRVLERLENSDTIELSTGLFVDNERAGDGATFNGQPYDFIARNYRPDHLAILPDQVGACSIQDGCGVMVNEKDNTVKGLILSAGQSGMTALSVMWHRLADIVSLSTATANESSSRLLGFVAEMNGHIHSVSVDENGNGITSDDSGHSHVVSKFRVQSSAGHTHSLSRESLADTGIKTMERGSVETGYVTDDKGRRWKTFEPIDNEEAVMPKKELIDSLIANCDCWSEEDREILNSLGEERLAKLSKKGDEVKQQKELVANISKDFEDRKGNTFTYKDGKWGYAAKEEEIVANKEEPKQLTLEEWQAIAPQEVLDTFAHAKGIEDRERTGLIARITANVIEADKEGISKLLEGENTTKLRQLLVLSGPVPTDTGQTAEALQPSYLGAAPAVNVDPKQSEELKNDIIPIPTIDWAAEAEVRRQA